MKKTVMILALMLAAGSFCRAESPRRATFAVEWGFTPTLYQNYKFVYKDDYGTTVSDIESGFCYEDDYYCLLRAGVRIGDRSELSAVSGLMGIGDKRRCIPLLLRYNFAFGGTRSDGALLFADGGVGFPIRTSAAQPASIGRIGGGYRLILGRGACLDITAGVRICIDHPCEKASIRKNEACDVGASVGVALGF